MREVTEVTVSVRVIVDTTDPEEAWGRVRHDMEALAKNTRHATYSLAYRIESARPVIELGRDHAAA